MIARTLLMPTDRIPRVPLELWATRLRTELARLVAQGADTVHQQNKKTSEIANNAALIAAHHGRPATAWALCEAQVRHHVRIAGETGDPEIAELGLQPWINLGRLEALRGDWEAAIRRLHTLCAEADGDEVRLGDVRLDCGAWREAGIGVENFLGSVYVVDTLKALLQARRFTEVLAFVTDPGRETAEHLRLFGVEAAAVAHAHRGDLNAALGAATTGLAEAKALEKVVFRLRQAEVLAAAGRADEAGRLLAATAEVVVRVSAEAMSTPSMLAVVLRMGSASREAGRDHEALRLARRAHEGALAADDEPFRIEALRLLLDLAPADEQARYEDELAEVLSTTLYQRHRPGRTVGESPVLEGLYEEMEEVLKR